MRRIQMLGCEEERSAYKSACMRERDIAKNLHVLKTKLILVKRDMATKLNYRRVF
jgi:hypothetical protein